MSLTISGKYQVVIPKAIRKQLAIKPGQRIDKVSVEGTKIIFETGSVNVEAILKKYAGSLKGVWHDQGLSADEWLRRERDSWDR